MKNINNYDSFLNEYYKGKNKTAGFNYSNADISLDVEFYAAIRTDMKEEKFEEIIDTYFNQIFDTHTKMIDIVGETEQTHINNVVKIDANINKDGNIFNNIFSVDVKFDGYGDTEAFSMIDALMKKMQEEYYITILPQKLNGKIITEPQYLPKAKKKIGY